MSIRSAPLALLVLLLLAALSAHGTSSPIVSGQEQTVVAIGDFFYCDRSFDIGECETVISAGDTVLWDYSSGTVGHTVTDCEGDCDTDPAQPLFDSGVIEPNGTFSFTFDAPGTYLYRCELHPVAMRGVVTARPPPASPTGSPAATPGEATPAAVADGGNGTSPLWFVLAGLAVGLLLLGGGAFAYRRLRA